jgi:hypothetical protein
LFEASLIPKDEMYNALVTKGLQED